MRKIITTILILTVLSSCKKRMTCSCDLIFLQVNSTCKYYKYTELEEAKEACEILPNCKSVECDHNVSEYFESFN